MCVILDLKFSELKSLNMYNPKNSDRMIQFLNDNLKFI